MNTKAERKAHLARRRTAHHQALASLHATPDKADGLKMWRALRRLESIAHAHATAYCNGEKAQLPGDGFLYNYGADSEGAWDALKAHVKKEAVRIFGRIPPGFFVNGDARGHALKLDSEHAGGIPAGMETDWGQDGILAADIND